MRSLIVDRFSKYATTLRSHFDDRFKDPRSTRGDRFVWDYWHVPGQYTALRTPAWEFFPKKLYSRFHQELVQWGRENLGCHDVSPPWMSNYVEGCRQELHGDVGHGPFAFVFSLTLWSRRRFRGGETLLLRDEILDLRRTPERRKWEARGMEEASIFESLEPQFNRLTLFDPSIPHGVRRVEGTHDPRLGRLVIHGWFVNPRPFFRGKVRKTAVSEAISSFVPPVRAEGWVVLRIQKTNARTVACLLWHRLVCEEEEKSELLSAAIRHFAEWDYGKGTGEITLPLGFGKI